MNAQELMNAMALNGVETKVIKKVAPAGVYTVKCTGNTVSTAQDGELVFNFFYEIQGLEGYKNIPHRLGTKIYGTDSFFDQHMSYLADQWGLTDVTSAEVLQMMIDNKKEFKIAWIPSKNEKFDGLNATARPADIKAAEILMAIKA